MAYKDLLVIVDDDPCARERVSHAADLAERFDAHLAGLCVSSISVPEALQKTAAARELFEGAVGQRGISAEWRTATGFPVDVAAVQARYADLVVLGQLDPEDAQAPSTARRRKTSRCPLGDPLSSFLMSAATVLLGIAFWSPGTPAVRQHVP